MKLFPAPYRAFCYSEVVLVSVIVLETMSRLINREIILPDFSNWYLSGNLKNKTKTFACKYFALCHQKNILRQILVLVFYTIAETSLEQIKMTISCSPRLHVISIARISPSGIFKRQFTHLICFN